MFKDKRSIDLKEMWIKNKHILTYKIGKDYNPQTPTASESHASTLLTQAATKVTLKNKSARGTVGFWKVHFLSPLIPCLETFY